MGSSLQLFSLCEHVTPHGRRHQGEDGFPSMALWRNYFHLPSIECARNPFRTSTVLEKSNKFATTFKDYGIWFDHVIKVEKDNMFSADHLWKFIMCGAMILCSNNQKGIDVVIPICHTQQPLSRDSVTAILVQVKNTEEYQHEFKKTSFGSIDPIQLGLFPPRWIRNRSYASF